MGAAMPMLHSGRVVAGIWAAAAVACALAAGAGTARGGGGGVAAGPSTTGGCYEGAAIAGGGWDYDVGAGAGADWAIGRALGEGGCGEGDDDDQGEGSGLDYYGRGGDGGGASGAGTGVVFGCDVNITLSRSCRSGLEACGKSFNDAGNWFKCTLLSEKLVKYCQVYQTAYLERRYDIGFCVPTVCNDTDLLKVYSVLRCLAGNNNMTGVMVDCSVADLKLSPAAFISITAMGILALIHLTGTIHEVFTNSIKKRPIIQQMVAQPAPVSTDPSSETPSSTTATATPTETTAETPAEVAPAESPPSPQPEQSDWSQFYQQPLVLSRVYEENLLHFVWSIIDCFSLRLNFWKMLEVTSHSTLDSLNGLRFLSMLWIILGSTFVLLFKVGVADPDVLPNYFKYPGFQAVFGIDFAIDCLLYISGFLIAYLSITRIISGTMNWVVFLLQRAWRLIPSYGFCLIVYTQLSIYFGDGPFWSQYQHSSMGVESCATYWWTNLLYMNNIYPIHFLEQCMLWTWYLAVDMQLYLFCAPLLLLYAFKTRVAYIVSIIICAANVCYLLLMAILLDIQMFSEEWLDWVLDKPWARTFPYLFGFITAARLLQMPKENHTKWYWLLLIWIAGGILILAPVFGKIRFFSNEWTTAESVLYIGLSSASFSAGVSILMLVVLSGQCRPLQRVMCGSALVPLARLNYSAFLVHPIIIAVAYYNFSNFLPFTMYQALYLFIGHVFITYFAACLVFLLIEQPVLNLEQLIKTKLALR
ncbi:nose resistant to fluoxetine protein 6 [Pelomyxa schiedti]|nr:nose resistant to fluoxetine protein 6 [Pelomyxa schiedti]